MIYRITVIGMVFLGSVAAIPVVLDLADLFMSIKEFLYLFTIISLNRYAFAALKDYMKQKETGKDSVFYVPSIPGLENTECWEREKLEEKVG